MTTNDFENLDFEADTGAEEIILPEVQGWKLLLLPLKPKEKTDGGIIKPESVLDVEALTATYGKVFAIGDLAYTRADMLDPVTKERRPWCKVGDIVLFGKYAGLRVKYMGLDVRLINDDEVIAVVPPQNT